MDESTASANDTSNTISDEASPVAPIQTQTTDPLQQTRDLAGKYADQSLQEDPDPLRTGETKPAETAQTEEKVQETTETQTTVPQETEQTTSEEEDEPYTPQAAPGLQPLDYTKFVDENGMLDVKALGEAQNQQLANAVQTATVRARQEYDEQRREEREWNKAVEQFPALKANRALRDMVQNARIGNVTDQYQRAGNNPELLAKIRVPSPVAVAKTLFDFTNTAKAEAIKEATESVKIQESAYVETASNAHEPDRKEQLYSKIGDPKDPLGAQKAQRDLLKALLFGE